MKRIRQLIIFIILYIIAGLIVTLTNSSGWIISVHQMLNIKILIFIFGWPFFYVLGWLLSGEFFKGLIYYIIPPLAIIIFLIILSIIIEKILFKNKR